MKDQHTPDPLSFLHAFRLSDGPPELDRQARRLLIDLCGIAQAGARTKLARIIAEHAAEDFAGTLPLIGSDLSASPSGFALAGGMTIDAVDGHDGYNPAKGHIGCALLPGLLALAPEDCTGTEFLEAVVLGYEFGARLSETLHATARDYHTSGAWMAVCVAAMGARLLKLGEERTAHALGIAEYHGPRSQMMRVIDHPTMLKDGSGWGAMVGVSAVRLAARGFTGAPALTLEGAHWRDLGQTWRVFEQYIKPYPTCRWSHAPIEAALEVQTQHGIVARDIVRIEIETFHNACRLACAEPQSTEEAQYSTSFPVAVALTRGGLNPRDIEGEVLRDPEILRLSRATVMAEHPEAEAPYPARRLARVGLILRDGQRFASDWHEPKWEHDAPPSDDELLAKYQDVTGGSEQAHAVLALIEALPRTTPADLRTALSGSP